MIGGKVRFQSARLNPTKPARIFGSIEGTARKTMNQAIKGLILMAGKDSFKNGKTDMQNDFSLISDHVLDMVSQISLEGIFLYVSPSHEKVLGFKPSELLGTCGYRLVHPDDLESTLSTVRAGIEGQAPMKFEYRSRHQAGHYIWTEANANPLLADGGRLLGAIMVTRDITQRKEAEEALVRARNELEQKVLERTEGIRRRQEELQTKNRELEELNTTLKILLNRIEKDKQDMGDNILANVRDHILPYIGKMKRRRLDAETSDCLSLIEASLSQIVSPFARRLTSQYARLTPREIQIAHLIREGRNTKEIAQILCLSLPTVEFHRHNLRKKLGIEQKNNLRSCLMSLD